MKLWHILLLIGTALVAGTVGFLARPWLTETVGGVFGFTGSSGKLATVGVRPDAVSALGRLEPAGEVLDVGVPMGSRISRVLVKEGELVLEGKPLAYLDMYEEAVAARVHVQSQLQEAKKRYTAETAFAQAAIEQANVKIREAKEVMPLAVKAQEAQVSRAKSELLKAERDRDRFQQMLNSRSIPRSQYDSVALRVQQAEEQVRAYEATLSQLQKDKEIKLALAKAALKSAQAGLERAQLATQLASLQEALKVAEAKVNRAIIHAPADGEILQILTHGGEVTGGAPLLKMGNTKSMYVLAEVYETDKRFVQKGQRAKITSKSFPANTVLNGTIERVGKLIRRNSILNIDPTADVDNRVVEVRIRLDESTVAARYTHMQVDVKILVDSSGS